MANTSREPGTHKLGQLAATAICGNDITSSCLYVSALATMAAARLSPISLLIVAAVLFLFRRVYAEVVGALLLNGGAYNALLNTTSKSRASVAACLTLLSYMATAVISGLEAMHYALGEDGDPTVVVVATIGLLAVFMILTIIGITESANVAIGIFLFHMVTLGLLIVLGLTWFFFSSDPNHLAENFEHFGDGPVFRQQEVSSKALMKPDASKENLKKVIPEVVAGLNQGTLPEALRMHLESKGIELDGSDVQASGDGREWTIGNTGVVVRTDEEQEQLTMMTETGLLTALFFGFCAAMLGISGFESSANFVEEQREGVFPKTLRNMWLAVSILNPAMALLTLMVLRVGDVGFHKHHLLAHLGEATAGDWLKWLIRVDAVLVLSGAVLTSYVGVTGLVHRMTLDRCLPQFLLKRNRRGTTHRIIIAFFLMAVSVLLITRGELEALAGVYTLSFLAVMVLFATGNILLKIKRSRLPRPTRTPWLFVVIALLAVLAALVGIAIDQPEYLIVFLWYFLPSLAIVMIMLWRIGLLKACMGIIKYFGDWVQRLAGTTVTSIEEKIDEINSQQIVFFTRGDKVDNLRRAIEYVRQNEHTKRIKIVTVVEDVSQVPEKLGKDLDVLDEAYPTIKIDLEKLEGTFSPALIDKLSEKWKIPKNLMFIGSHGEAFKYDQAELGGVRLII